MKKHFLKFLSFALTALSTFTAFAQSESIVTLAGNAYITAATQQTGETNQRARKNRTFIDEHNSAIRNHQPMGTHRWWTLDTCNKSTLHLRCHRTPANAPWLHRRSRKRKLIPFYGRILWWEYDVRHLFRTYRQHNHCPRHWLLNTWVKHFQFEKKQGLLTLKQIKLDIKLIKADLDFVRKYCIFVLPGGNYAVSSFFWPQNGKNDLKGRLNFFKGRRNDLWCRFSDVVCSHFYPQFCSQNLQIRRKNNFFEKNARL